MEQFSGTLMRDGQVVVQTVNGRLTVDWTPSREQRWSGFFTLPADVSAQVNDVFELTLTDGRSAKIKLDRVNVTAAGVFVSFAHMD